MGGAISITYVLNYFYPKVNKLILLAAAAPSFIQREGYPCGFTRKEVNEILLQLYYNRPGVLADLGAEFFAAEHGMYFKE
ncbi:hypothetical protein ACFQPF_02905 [Fictibacillus iocasae]|uniref:Serine aminopeptidase S33 domain-containing protein n=1 Tax=Fictibacillus iocasae TaxID=2715437 RepID=A0ABW2NMH8_9BACL